jgi:glycosyltransferase involved in cell wall biosynthesis
MLPTLNEEEIIGRGIDEIPRATLEKKGYQVRVLVVDGNSTDLTWQIAQERGAEVIIEPKKGEGRAMRTALSRSRLILCLCSMLTTPILPLIFLIFWICCFRAMM